MNKIILISISLLANSLFSQDKNNYIKSSYENLRARDMKKLSHSFSQLDTISIAYKSLLWEKKMLQEGNIDLKIHNDIVNTTLFNLKDSILVESHKAEFYINNNNQDKAYLCYEGTLRKAIKKKDSLFICKSLYGLLQLTTRNDKLIKFSNNYIKNYKKYAYNDLEKAYANYYAFYFQTKEKKTLNLDSIQFQINLAIKSKSDFCLLEYYQRIGVGYDIYLKIPDSAITYYRKALNIIEQNSNYHFIKQRKKGILNNLGCIYYEKEKYNESLKYFLNAQKIRSAKKRLLNDSVITSWLINNYEKLNKLDSTVYYFKKMDTINRELNQEKYATKIDELNKKYNLSEKEKQILLEQQKKKRSQNISIGLGSSLVLGSIITILIYRNTKRKQHIAEQEREIEIQKTEKLLKEQELTAIDAMISGQEKERQRLANDLHDNLGSTLATVKLHFDHLKNNRDNPKVENTEELYSKTNALLNEAYQKVRTIAHEKNSGVIAKQGLLPAVKNLAKKASNSNGLKIEIQDHGLEERLDNVIEISIFRIIQELITNGVKHANATEINISLTNHDSLLNVIVEDNGKGFNAKILPEKDGMGLKSIEKRIEHMEGTFEIDSTLGRGTNIIINIPI